MSWKAKPALQQPNYPDPARLKSALEALSLLPPLVTWWEAETLKSQLAEAAQGKRFLLQGGDCAERFSDCDATRIANKLKILLQMSLVLTQGLNKPVTRMGRIAGQYAKPRTDDLETRNGVTLPAYRGDLVNRPEFTAADRTPDPSLLLRAYERAALTLNHIRALAQGGFADLHHPEYWDLDFVHHSPWKDDYQQLVHAIGEALRFMENILGVNPAALRTVEFFTCHEGLHLSYEAAQTRQVENGRWYNLSTHFPWIGVRTSDPEGAHTEYFRGIANPIGVKIGPSTTPETLARLLDTLHPDNEPGRLTLIHRCGAARIAGVLPPLIETVRASGKTVAWVADPMHGNTLTSTQGVKTRRFSDILSELEQAMDLHASLGSVLAGVHFELTGDNVTECTGGARGLSDEDLGIAYQSEVDPRLNYEQALEMSLRIARRITRRRYTEAHGEAK
ncbi:MAG: 3-deoxy-7-phosphoheptulonate synthase class II [Bryobacteraceae bacterium]|nr:3-deoxy-7-phosphoheptulonate synthase class II [Bryobacteraceae bacterium]